MKKICGRCKVEKPTTDFYKMAARSHLDGVGYYCKPCCTDLRAEAYQSNPEAAKAVSKAYRLRHPERVKAGLKAYRQVPEHKRRAALAQRAWLLGMSWQEFAALYDRLFVEQKGLCASCGEKPDYRTERTNKLYLDHDHKTRRPRQLLCTGCNAAIGHMLESPKRLRDAAAYLERHSQPISNLVPFRNVS